MQVGRLVFDLSKRCSGSQRMFVVVDPVVLPKLSDRTLQGVPGSTQLTLQRSLLLWPRQMVETLRSFVVRTRDKVTSNTLKVKR
jgi:hypothetical protein